MSKVKSANGDAPNHDPPIYEMPPDMPPSEASWPYVVPAKPQPDHNHVATKSTPRIQDQVIEDRSTWLRMGPLRFNPVVTFLAVVIIWSFIGGCISDPEAADTNFKLGKAWVADIFTWLYIGSQDIWAVFFIWLYFSKYSSIKLGKDEDEPEYNNVTWFFMFFSCGVSVGLFFYGVAEPIFHYVGPNRYTADHTMPDNTLAQIAMNVTFYHWGIHGWIVYSILGAILGLVSYRKGLPMTIKSCFWPLIGDKIFGWVGDAIDTLSIFTTLFGVCTSLGLGAIQLNKGINIFDPEGVPVGVPAQVVIVWCITVLATISTVSGIGLGIRRLSEFCFSLGLVLLFSVFFLDNTWFILNLFCQSIGYYFQWIMQLGWHTDAFEQLNPSSGGQDRNREYEDGAMDGPDRWMDWWTIFYWGWWIAWCPFVGMFIAKISKGRTIREFINGTMTAPIAFSFIWFSIFGGAGLHMERAAAGRGLCCNAGFNSTLMAQALNDSLPISLTTPIGPDYTQIEGLNETCLLDANGKCKFDACTNNLLGRASKFYPNIDIGGFIGHFQSGELVPDRMTHADEKAEAEDRSLVRLSCQKIEGMWFDLMNSYGDMGNFLSVISIIGIILYFVTSSDSGSLVIDCLSANGDPDPPAIQRVFWALTEGATATALLVAGGDKGLNALQTVSIIMGLPYTIIVCFICVSLYRLLQHEIGELDLINDPKFRVSLLDPFATWNPRLTGEFFLNIFAAPYTIGKVAAQFAGSTRTWLFCLPFLLSFLLFIILHVCVIAVGGIWALAWISYLAYASLVTSVRINARTILGINGNPVEDFFAALLYYPGVAVQLNHAAADIAAAANAVAPPPNEVVTQGGNNNPAFVLEVSKL